MINLTDTHAHLFWDSYKKDLDKVLDHSLASGITTIINIGTDKDTSKKALDLNSPNPKIKFYSTIGIHPHEATKYQNPKSLQQDLKLLEEIYFKNPKKVIGVGECGLDFFFDPKFIPKNLSLKDCKALQIQLFISQINLAKKLNLPLLIHCRDDRSKDPENSEAWDKTLEITKNHFGILHCYSGLPHQTNYILQNTNFLISFAANITYPKNDYLRQAAKTIPLEKIVLETDSPFLSPQSKRGQRNDPTTVLEIAKLISSLKNLSLEEVSLQTTKNAIKLLNLS